jgi:vitamin B12 transporter
MARIAVEADTFGKAWTHKAFASYFEDRLDSRSTFSNFTSSNVGERLHYGYQSTLRFDSPSLMTKHVLTGLIERKDEDFFAEADFPSFFFAYENEASRAQTGFVVEYRADIADALFLSGNLRYDDNETFDDAVTYRVTAAYLFRSTGTRLHASLGKGVTNPTFFEQFGFDLNFQGNPDIKPEESVGFDIGVEQTFIVGALVVDVTYFNATLKDEITGSGNTVVNQAGESDRQGVETQLTWKPLEGLAIAGSYTYTDATEPDGSEEIRRPQHSAALNVNYLFAAGRAQINFGVIYNGDMKDTLFDFAFFPDYPRVDLDQYVIVNLSGSYRLDDNVTLFGRAENLLDEDYEEVVGYASQPVAVFGGVKITLGGGAAPLERKAD